MPATTSSSSRRAQRADEVYRDRLIEFMDRVWFAALPLPLPSHHFLNAPRPTAARRGATQGGQTSSPPPSSASSDSSGSDVELELAEPEGSQAGTAAAAAATAGQATSSSSKANGKSDWSWFCIDDDLTYLSFAHDFGPLNIAKVYEFCIRLHTKLQEESNAHVNFVLYTSTDPQRKANAALLVALYALIVGRKKPWEAFQPIAEEEFMPFRDAGRCEADYGLSIQDCLYGMFKALELGLIDLSAFNPEEYCYYEQVQNGDFNWVSKNFIAFASPTDNAYVRAVNTNTVGAYERDRKRSKGYANVLRYFEESGVKLVVRLNNPLYDRRDFERRGIEFKDMFFEDGTNPPKEMVREFLRDADRVIGADGVIAIHCKAGLGRTGCLIAAHLVYKYGFTAGEVIGFMRICRPGMVVGPQQQYIHHNHLEWVKWAAADEAIASYKAALETETARTRKTVRPATPPAERVRGRTAAVGGDDDDDVEMDPLSTPARKVALPSVTPARHASAADGMTPCLQPRKTPLAKRTAEALDEADSSSDLDDDPLGRLPAHATKYRKSGQTDRIEVESMLLAPAGSTTSELAPTVAPPPQQYRSAARPVPLSSPAKRSNGSGTSFGAESTSTAANPSTVARGRAAASTASSSALPRSTRKVGPATDSRVGFSKTVGLTSSHAPGPGSPTPNTTASFFGGGVRTAGSPSSRLPTLSGLPIRSGVKRLFGNAAGAATGSTAGSKTGKVKSVVDSASAGGIRLDSGKRVLKKRRSSLSIADFIG